MACALTSAGAVRRLSQRDTIRLALTAAVLGNFPDADLIPASLIPAHFWDIHRYVGHNVFAIALEIWAGVQCLRWAVPSLFRGHRAWLFSVALVLSHVLFDGCSDFAPLKGTRAGVPLFWPFSDWQFLTEWPVFGGYTLEKAAHPLLSYWHAREFWDVLLSTEIPFTAGAIAAWWLAVKAWVGLRRLLSASDALPDPRFRLKL